MILCQAVWGGVGEGAQEPRQLGAGLSLLPQRELP